MIHYGTVTIPYEPFDSWKYNMDASATAEIETSKSKKVLLACRNLFWTYIPITKWLPEYKWREYFLGDLMAGMTLGCLHVPQALAFSNLAGVNPKMGLCTACISVYLYCLFGTAVICSYGPVSVTSLLTGNSVDGYSEKDSFSNEQLATVITFLLGLYYLCAYILRFWIISKLLTKAFNSSFILALCINVIMKSVKQVLGLKIKSPHGYFSIFYDTYYTYQNIPSTNLVAAGISIGVFSLFFINTFAIQPAMEKKTKVVIPVEMVVIIFAIALSYFLKLNKDHDVIITGYIPKGFPPPSPPVMDAVGYMAIPSIVVGLVNFVTTLSVVVMFNSEARPNQELLALGLVNLLACCFNTIPFGNSMMRTAIAQRCGIYTLMASIISSTIVVMVVLFMSPLFEPLPLCVLGCIIIYGLGTLAVKQIKSIPTVYKSGWENRFIWIITFLLTLCVAIEVGLLIGICFTIRQFLSHPENLDPALRTLSEEHEDLPSKRPSSRRETNP